MYFQLIRHRDGNCGVRKPHLHHDLAAPTAHLVETMPPRNRSVHLLGKDSEPIQSRFPACHEYFFACALPDFFRRRGFEKQLQRLPQIVARVSDRFTLARDVDFGAQGDVAIPLTFDDRCELHLCDACCPVVSPRRVRLAPLRSHHARGTGARKAPCNSRVPTQAGRLPCCAVTGDALRRPSLLSQRYGRRRIDVVDHHAAWFETRLVPRPVLAGPDQNAG